MDKQRWHIRLARDERGATAVEYGLIVSLIVLAAIGAYTRLATTTIGMWNGVAKNVGTGNPSP